MLKDSSTQGNTVSCHSLVNSPGSILTCIGAKEELHANCQEGSTQEEAYKGCPGHMVAPPVPACPLNLL